MTLVWLGIALWVVVIINRGCSRIAAAFDRRPLTDYDRRCSRLDQEWDELEARRRTRPHGNCEVIYGPWDRGAA